MMRLGNVMVKIDEQAAQKRHSSYLRRKTRIIKSMPFLKPSENEHKAVRAYKSLVPMCKLTLLQCVSHVNMCKLLGVS